MCLLHEHQQIMMNRLETTSVNNLNTDRLAYTANWGFDFHMVDGSW